VYRWIPFSLVDSPNGIAAVAFAKGCYFSCFYCHNPSLKTFEPEEEDLTVDDIVTRIYAINPKNIDWLTVSGGEPLFKDIDELKMIFSTAKSCGLKTTIYTTGCLPNKIEKLLDYVDSFHIDYKLDKVMTDGHTVDNRTLESIGIVPKDRLIVNTVVTELHTPDLLKAMERNLEGVNWKKTPVNLLSSSTGIAAPA